MKFPKKLTTKLKIREENNSLRILSPQNNLVDFSSNDYLGFAKSEAIFEETHQFLVAKNSKQNGATGSRLLSGNHFLNNEVEGFLSQFHQTSTATIFNSGYDANIGLFSCVPQRNDIILYDELCHASIRDGIQLSHAKSFKFLHNNLSDLEKRLLNLKEKAETTECEIYVVTESVFSMDGDSPDLISIAEICKKHKAFLIVDEAHAVGVFGTQGCGLVQKLKLQDVIFARIITFGKAMGCHGAAILGSQDLQNYLVNFARSFIYTTGLSPHSLASIQIVYNSIQKKSIKTESPNKKLKENIEFFKLEIIKLQFPFFPLNETSKVPWGFIESNAAIHSCVIPGNIRVKKIAEKLRKKGFETKAILSPTVPKQEERLRFCLHSYNSKKEIREVLYLLSIFVKKELLSNIHV
jgi:8-amino-7-oxononanoate synthase